MKLIPFPRTFTASFIKELREHAVWAALGGSGLAVLLAATLFVKQPEAMGLVGDTYMALGLITFCAAGFALGLAVTLPDLRRGHFGFSVHRPARRWTLFAAKLTAAALLYGLATSLAVGVSAAFAADPRVTHAPFDAAMLKPSVYFQGAGLPWLACGMLVAARRARWVGSRLFPVVVPALFALWTNLLTVYLYEAVAVALLTAVPLAVAAGAYYCRNGRFEGQPLWAKPVSGLFAFAGAGAVLGAVVGVTTDVLQTLGGPRQWTTTFSENYILGPDGEALIRQFHYQGNHGQGTDLTPDRRPAPPTHVYRRGEARPWTVQSTYTVLAPDAGRIWRAQDYGFLRPKSYLCWFNPDADGNRWAFDAARRLFVGMDDRGVVATLGPAGEVNATPGGPEAAPFAPGVRLPDQTYVLLNSPAVLTPGEAYVVDLNRHAVHPLYAATPGDPIIGVQTAFADDEDRPPVPDNQLSQWVPYLKAVVRTTGGLHAVTLANGPVADLPLPQVPWNRPVVVRVQPSGDVSALLGANGFGDGPVRLIRRVGGRVTQETLPPLLPSQSTGQPARWWDHAPDVFMPPALMATFWAAGKWSDRSVPPLKMVGLVLTGGAAAVALTWGMARRRGLGGASTGTWLTLAALLGPVTPLAMLCLLDRPARVRCPACGKWRRLDVDACDRCGRPFPPPADPLTAVFEEVAAA